MLVIWFISDCPFIEFIHLVSSEANEICNRQLKKTILPEHVFQALQVTFFDYNKVACHTQTTNNLLSFVLFIAN